MGRNERKALTSAKKRDAGVLKGKGGKERLGEKGARGGGDARGSRGEVKNSSYKHSECDTLVSSTYIKARGCSEGAQSHAIPANFGSS